MALRRTPSACSSHPSLELSTPMSRKPRAPAAPTAPAMTTRSKRKAASAALAPAPPGSSAATGIAISPMPKKRRTSMQTTQKRIIAFPTLDEKDVIELCDEEDDGDEAVRLRGATSTDDEAVEIIEPLRPTRIAVPDAHIGPEYRGRVRVLQSGTELFDAMLTRACLYENQNEFALLQALVSDSGEFVVWMRKGLVGTPGESELHGPYEEARAAIAQFKALFEAKTNAPWKERDIESFGQGGFICIETHMSTEDDAKSDATEEHEIESAPRKRRTSKKSRARQSVTARKARAKLPPTELSIDKTLLPSNVTSPPSRLDRDVQTFLTMVTEAASMHSNAADARYFAITAAHQTKGKGKTRATASSDEGAVVVPIPLGKLSKTTIARGFDVLNRIHDALQRRADRKVLTALSSHFYSVVPHTHLRLIDSILRLTEKVEMLVALCIHGGHTELLHPELTWRYFRTNHLDISYETLDCRLFPLLPSSREFGLVQAYIFNSYCCVGKNVGAEGKLVTVFRVEKPSEATRFAAYRGAANRRVLWHGTRMSNWLSILKHGLLITPAGVPLNGSSLGAGLYFTDKISKAMAYSHASHDHQVFLLSEVALGQCKPSTAGIRSGSSSSVHHSCHGVGRCIPDSAGDYVDAFGAIWPLGKAMQTKDAHATHGHNEFVVYNTAQARMRYIVVTKPLY